MTATLTHQQMQTARLSRDARFDGGFFVAVKTTGIFCRPVCPANAPKERNVEYFSTAAQAANAGYRPCLRCHPESAPGSWAWRGAETSFLRALRLIDEGALQEESLEALAERLGISDRYLRKLFQQHLGLAPKQYALLQQLMFAKQLLHHSQLSIADIGLASGFNSVRRFNDAFQKHLKLKPSEFRKTSKQASPNHLYLAYRPPLNWDHTLNFLKMRLIDGVEAIEGQRYRRRFQLNQAQGWFSVEPCDQHALRFEFDISDLKELKTLVAQVRRMFDLDADLHNIETHLSNTPLKPLLTEGIRIPGVWSPWEAGVRAVLGQQVSVKAAINHLNQFVQQCGDTEEAAHGLDRMFPTPQAVANSDLGFLRMPQSRKDTLTRLAEFVAQHPTANPAEWLALKGIGPWTVQYAQLRGCSEPDHFLITDLVVKKALQRLPEFNTNDASPWGSYATFHCWNAQS
jgi:AraC family transcriptional regulator of adaptative response / DNA-3-methyladenine glycosylase II